MRLTPVRVTTRDHLEALRQIRNECRLFMTGHTEEINPDQQFQWWAYPGKETRYVWLYADKSGRFLGFSMIRTEQLTLGPHGYGHSRKWWGTLGLREKARGQGYGTEIYRHLGEEAAIRRGSLHIIVRHDNIPSIRAAIRAGFQRCIEADTDKPTWQLFYAPEESC